MSVLVKGGTIVTSTGRYVADVYAEGDKIKTIGVDLDNPADEVVDASGKYVLPGAIDPHTHISMPFMGTNAQDDYETGTIAAACGVVASSAKPSASTSSASSRLILRAFSITSTTLTGAG